MKLVTYNKWIFLLLSIILTLPTPYKCSKQIDKNDVDGYFGGSDDDDDDVIFEKNFNNENSIWTKSFLFIKRNMKKCLFKGRNYNGYINKNWMDSKEFLISTGFTNTWINCFKAASLKLFDGITALKVITLMDGVQLIQIRSKNDLSSVKKTYKGQMNIVENLLKLQKIKKLQNTNNDVKLNSSELIASRMTVSLPLKTNMKEYKKNIITQHSKHFNVEQQMQKSTTTSSLSSLSWLQDILNKINTILTTHILQIDLSKIEKHQENNNNNNNNDSVIDDNLKEDDKDIVTARHRHRRNNMMLAMMFGVTAMGVIVVPIGFQFLSVIAGKALLLSKMALMLASVSSLRKIAASGIHYGLYQIPDNYGGYGGYFDRGDAQAPPRFPRSVS